jgi:exodeoxyribonuclease V beta subunit
LFPPAEKERFDPPSSARLKDFSDEALLAGLRELEATGAARVRNMDWDFETAPLERGSGVSKTFSALSVARPIRTWRRVESFSALVRNLLHSPAEEDDVAKDRDDGAESPETSASVVSAEAPAVPEAFERIVLDGFPRGRVTGDFFHAILEEIDFETAEGPDLLEVAERKFEAFGFARETAADVVDDQLAKVVASLRHLLDTPIAAAGGFCLRDVPKTRRFSELEFHVPAALDAASGSASGRLDRRILGAVFRDHPSSALPAAYAERVERLGFEPLSGFLKGYIDLVFEHAGRFYVVDYKTNHLSDFVHEYDAERMTAAMGDAHYFLQYHLYALAVSRFLVRTLSGFDYERHFGGALYLFMKGMRPGHDTGIFFEKPPLARMRALSRAFGGSSW